MIKNKPDAVIYNIFFYVKASKFSFDTYFEVLTSAFYYLVHAGEECQNLSKVHSLLKFILDTILLASKSTVSYDPSFNQTISVHKLSFV